MLAGMDENQADPFGHQRATDRRGLDELGSSPDNGQNLGHGLHYHRSTEAVCHLGSGLCTNRFNLATSGGVCFANATAQISIAAIFR
jgi:hypothetical protein